MCELGGGAGKPGGGGGPASFAAVRAAVPDASPALVAAVKALADASGDGPDTTSAADVALYLRLFQEAVENFYPSQEPPADVFADVPPQLRAARCELDARRGALKVIAVARREPPYVDEEGLVRDPAWAEDVAWEADDTAAFAASLMRPRGGGATAAADALSDAFRIARLSARPAAPPGTLAYATVLAEAPPRNGDDGGWRVALEPDGMPALLPVEEMLPGEASYAIGCVPPAASRACVLFAMRFCVCAAA
jgi:hypothetical protein